MLREIEGMHVDHMWCCVKTYFEGSNQRRYLSEMNRKIKRSGSPSFLPYLATILGMHPVVNVAIRRHLRVFSREDVVWLCIHGVVQDKKQHPFLIYAGCIHTVCVLLFFFLSFVQGGTCLFHYSVHH